MNQKQQIAIERGKKDYLETSDVYSAVSNMMFYIDAPLSDKEWAAAVIEFLTWVKDQTE